MLTVCRKNEHKEKETGICPFLKKERGRDWLVQILLSKNHSEQQKCHLQKMKLGIFVSMTCLRLQELDFHNA